MKRTRASAPAVRIVKVVLAAIVVVLAACSRSALDADLLGSAPVTSPTSGTKPTSTTPGCAADTSSDPSNCGACGHECSAGQSCCGGACTDTQSDLANCGACGGACSPGADHCLAGLCCTPQPGGGEVCGKPVCDCGVGETCCASGCVDTTKDPNNCGACGDSCGAGGSCTASVCNVTCNAVACAAGAVCCASGCAITSSDSANCGQCDNVCGPGLSCTNGVCSGPCNGGPACAFGQSCCASGCTPTTTDPFNCGGCGIQCGATAGCIDSECVASEGAFDPIVNPTYLPPGVHQFSTITVPAGVTVYVAGAGPASGTLDLHATGAILIDGTIDLSGGPGTQNTITSESTRTGRAGSGGFAGEPYASATMSAACEFIAGNAGSLGFALGGSSGSCVVWSTTTCGVLTDPATAVFTAPVASSGGGAGIFSGFRAYGSGGGGAGGGAPGALGPANTTWGQTDCDGVSGGGGAVAGAGGSAGGAPYDGSPGVLGVTECAGYDGFTNAFVGGGGGGSVGALAVADLAVKTTFQTGSGGGGGSADYLNRPVFGGTSGGAGGGGALALSTPATLTIHGQLLANGGIGGDAVIGTPGPKCDPQPGAGGGGGSGGVIVLSAPSITLGAEGTISAAGGAGGAQSEFASGGLGGAGGLGRIRLSVTPSSCSLAGTMNPPPASGCASANQAGFTYVGSYPN